MRARLLGYGSVLIDESKEEIESLEKNLQSRNIKYTKVENRDGMTIVYFESDYISKLPSNKYGSFLPVSQEAGPNVYEIYNTDII